MSPVRTTGIERIAVFLGYSETAAFVADLRAHLTSVERHYAELFEHAPNLAGPGNLVFTGDGANQRTRSRPSMRLQTHKATSSALDARRMDL